jgi:hypothetical protein
MHRVNQAVSVLPGGVPSPTRRQPPILAAYEHVRLDRQGMLVSPRTLEYYDDSDGLLLMTSAARRSVDVGVIDRARILRGWTRRDLGREANVDEGTLCDLFAGRRRPTFGTLRRSVTRLGCHLKMSSHLQGRQHDRLLRCV